MSPYYIKVPRGINKKTKRQKNNVYCLNLGYYLQCWDTKEDQ